MVLMEWRQPFDATHAEREIQRMDAAPQRAMWTAPNGSRFDLTVPPTVYPPREDTDLLASAISAQRMRPGRAGWKSVGSGALSLYAASLGCDITACDVNPMAVAQLELTSRLWVLEGEFTKEDRVPQPMEHRSSGEAIACTTLWCGTRRTSLQRCFKTVRWVQWKMPHWSTPTLKVVFNASYRACLQVDCSPKRALRSSRFRRLGLPTGPKPGRGLVAWPLAPSQPCGLRTVSR